jgi:hypothetical protein
MSALANGAPQWALIMGVFAACAWLVHGWQVRDNPIMLTNFLLLIIAMYGLIYN